MNVKINIVDEDQLETKVNIKKSRIYDTRKLLKQICSSEYILRKISEISSNSQVSMRSGAYPEGYPSGVVVLTEQGLHLSPKKVRCKPELTLFLVKNTHQVVRNDVTVGI